LNVVFIIELWAGTGKTDCSEGHVTSVGRVS